MPQASANLNIMIKAARKAARSLVRDFGEVEQLQVSSKSAGDFVSRADLKSEEIIREELIEARPNYTFVGEEGKDYIGEDPTRRWLVDPLDGTTNFLHGMPHWAVSIALEHRGQIVAAVVYDPIKDEMFTAEKGAGAWLNDSRIRVSDRSEMMASVFATGVPFAANPYLGEFLRQTAQLAPTCAGIRRWGAAALDLAYVAAGRFDGYWERRLNAWDQASGLLLVREAGGITDGFSQGEDPLETGHVIAANNVIFDRFAKIIREA